MYIATFSSLLLLELASFTNMIFSKISNNSQIAVNHIANIIFKQENEDNVHVGYAVFEISDVEETEAHT